MTLANRFKTKGLLTRRLVKRSSGLPTKGYSGYTKCITVPKRFLKRWERDGTKTEEKVWMIPLGGYMAEYGFLMLPNKSPLLSSMKGLEAEVMLISSILSKLIDEEKKKNGR